MIYQFKLQFNFFLYLATHMNTRIYVYKYIYTERCICVYIMCIYNLFLVKLFKMIILF